MVARTTCNTSVASPSLACVTFVFFFWQGRLVHMPMNTASRGLSVHSKRPHISGCVSTGKALSFFLRSRSHLISRTFVFVIFDVGYRLPHKGALAMQDDMCTIRPTSGQIPIFRSLMPYTPNVDHRQAQFEGRTSFRAQAGLIESQQRH